MAFFQYGSGQALPKLKSHRNYHLISGWTLYICLLGIQSNAICADIKPNAGSLLRDMPASNLAPDKSQDIQNIDNRNDDTFKTSDAFDVSRIVIDGNTVFPTKQLHELIKSLEGKTLTLEQLEQGIENITLFTAVKVTHWHARRFQSK